MPSPKLIIRTDLVQGPPGPGSTIAGPIGPTGPTGLVGPTGPTGPSGASGAVGNFNIQATALGTDPVTPLAVALVVGADQPVNTYTGPVAATAPSASYDGAVFRLRDIANAVNTYPITLTDPNGYFIQNPIDGQLYLTITWGPGSGGGANPNLSGRSSMTWARVTAVTGGLSIIFWQAVT